MKNKLRQEVNKQLSTLNSEQKLVKDNEINRNLSKFFNGLSNKKILSFKPLKSEPDINQFNEFASLNNNIFYPDNNELLIYDNLNKVVLDFSMLDYVIVPAIAVTKDGKRLGRGGGWYDRLLIQTQAQKICPVYTLQVIKDIPEDQHDQRIDIIITEFEIINLKKVTFKK